MKPFESFLAPQLKEFIAYRQSLGYSLRPVRDFLLIFDRYLMESKTNRGLLTPVFFLEHHKNVFRTLPGYSWRVNNFVPLQDLLSDKL